MKSFNAFYCGWAAGVVLLVGSFILLVRFGGDRLPPVRAKFMVMPSDAIVRIVPRTTYEIARAKGEVAELFLYPDTSKRWQVRDGDERDMLGIYVYQMNTPHGDGSWSISQWREITIDHDGVYELTDQ